MLIEQMLAVQPRHHKKRVYRDVNARILSQPFCKGAITEVLYVFWRGVSNNLVAQ